MSFQLLQLVFNGLSPIIPALILIGINPGLTTIAPWPVVGVLIVLHLLFALFAWKKLGYTQRCRVTEAAMLVVNAFIPLVTYSWLFPAGGHPISLSTQVFCTVWDRQYGSYPRKSGRIGWER